MKNGKTPFILRKGVVTAISIGFGAIIGGLNAGEYHGMKETNENWKADMYKVIEQSKNKSEEVEKEE